MSAIHLKEKRLGIEIQVDPNEPSRVVKIGEGQKNELAQQLAEFLSLSQDVFAWTHANMVRIHQPSHVPPVEHRPIGETSAPKVKSIRCRPLQGPSG